MTVTENGDSREITLRLERAPETQPRDERLIEGRNPFAGAVVANLSPRLAEELRMPTSLQGVVVTEVNRGSPAARIGLEPKDIVRSVNGTAIESSKTLESVVAEDASFWRVEIERNGQIIRQFFR